MGAATKSHICRERDEPVNEVFENRLTRLAAGPAVGTGSGFVGCSGAARCLRETPMEGRTSWGSYSGCGEVGAGAIPPACVVEVHGGADWRVPGGRCDVPTHRCHGRHGCGDRDAQEGIQHRAHRHRRASACRPVSAHRCVTGSWRMFRPDIGHLLPMAAAHDRSLETVPGMLLHVVYRLATPAL